MKKAVLHSFNCCIVITVRSKGGPVPGHCTLKGFWKAPVTAIASPGLQIA